MSEKIVEKKFFLQVPFLISELILGIIVFAFQVQNLKSFSYLPPNLSQNLEISIFSPKPS